MLQHRPPFENQTLRRILHGADQLADLVELTLGPVGRAVLIDRGAAIPLVGDNGYAVATHFDIADPVAQCGVQTLRHLAWEMSRDFGDGAATAIVLARAVLAELVNMMDAGYDPQHLGEAVVRRAKAIAAQIEASAVTANDIGTLKAVATTAAGGDVELGGAIGEAFHAVGRAGTVIVEAGHGMGDEIETRPGMHFDSGWLSEDFVNEDALGKAIYDDAYILVASGRIDRFDDILPMLEVFSQRKKPLIVIAGEVAGEALATLVLNRRKSRALVCAVAAPGAGDWKTMNLGDIAAATGATLIGDETGHSLAQIKPAMVGRARRIEIGRSHTAIVGGGADPQTLEARMAHIRSEIASARYLAYDREQHELRLARLSGAIALLRIGAATKPIHDQRLEVAKRAVAATRSARAAGVVQGGGTSFFRAAVQAAAAASGNETELMAAKVLAGALGAPMRAIVSNRGRDAAHMVGLVALSSDTSTGYDAAGDRITNLHAAGIIDACEITVEALTRAVATAATLGSVAAATSPLSKQNNRGAA
ncbi:chaperonin GroEL [Hoeflea sp. G2-23]|uniref:60 kDa chaperonin n=1 Tax=Hoeflea algicola TaxID=2983763 RepID=A0ABT3ZBY6_9HYPH|nr:chaperonin GroEL [Hoeflea algicola]MCY0149282.1 chaperonin GroEL [Hoeflea algicola]